MEWIRAHGINERVAVHDRRNRGGRIGREAKFNTPRDSSSFVVPPSDELLRVTSLLTYIRDEMHTNACACIQKVCRHMHRMMREMGSNAIGRDDIDEVPVTTAARELAHFRADRELTSTQCSLRIRYHSPSVARLHDEQRLLGEAPRLYYSAVCSDSP